MTKGAPVEVESLGSQIILERYKYLIAQKQHLNERTFQILRVYQSLIVLLIGGAFVVCAYWAKGDLDGDMASTFLIATIALLELVSAFACIGLLAGIASWLKYRREELALEKAQGLPTRVSATARDFLRWYETYFVLAIVAVAVALPWFLVAQILPRLS